MYLPAASTADNYGASHHDNGDGPSDDDDDDTADRTAPYSAHLAAANSSTCRWV